MLPILQIVFSVPLYFYLTEQPTKNYNLEKTGSNKAQGLLGSNYKIVGFNFFFFSNFILIFNQRQLEKTNEYCLSKLNLKTFFIKAERRYIFAFSGTNILVTKYFNISRKFLTLMMSHLMTQKRRNQHRKEKQNKLELRSNYGC